MGMIRVLLAVAVVLQHSYGMMFSGGYLAVQLFFIVAGFATSFTLIEQRHYPNVSAFFLNRFLRVFPIYYVVAVGSLAFYSALSFVSGNPTAFHEVYLSVDGVGQAFLAFANVFVVTQDWIMFTAVHEGVLHFHHDFQDTEVPVWRGLLVPPAWSIAIGLVSYLLAPFILPRLWLLVSLLALSFGVRALLIQMGLHDLEQWHHWFMPAELAYFIVGALAHQLWKPLVERQGLLTVSFSRAVTWCIVGLVLVFVTLDFASPKLVAIVVFVLSLPFLFQFQNAIQWDRWIGELGYPIYVVHWLLMVAANYVWDRFGPVPGYQGLDEALVVVALSFLAALILKRFVGDPIERIRTRIRLKAQAAAKHE